MEKPESVNNKPESVKDKPLIESLNKSQLRILKIATEMLKTFINSNSKSWPLVGDSSKGQRRNWLEMPPEIMSLIFQKLGVVDTLRNAQWVCTAWEKISLDPELWRCIHLPRRWDLFRMDRIAKEAVNRSQGELEEFSVIESATDELLRFVTIRSELRRLRLVDCLQVSDDGLIEIADSLYLLEELELCHCRLSTEVIEAFGNGCPQLTSFRLNYPRGSGFDEYALPIAKNMPQLRHLHLFGNKLTKDGLKTILDGCTHLESLDLRQCSYLSLDSDLLKRCADAGIRKLRLPNDSADDYEYGLEGLDDEEDDSFSEDSDL